MERRVAAIRAGTARSSFGCSSIPRSTPRGPVLVRRTCSNRSTCRCIAADAAAATPITGGQRIAYVMLDLGPRGRDVRCHVHRLEEWMIGTLARLNVQGERRAGPDRHLGRETRCSGAASSAAMHRQSTAVRAGPPHEHWSPACRAGDARAAKRAPGRCRRGSPRRVFHLVDRGLVLDGNLADPPTRSRSAPSPSQSPCSLMQLDIVGRVC